MAVLKNVSGNELLVDCCCGCDEGIRLRIDPFDDNDYSHYCFLSYTNGSFYREQSDTIFAVIYKKLKKIWAIIRNKDFYYAEITMTKDDFEEFKKYINEVK